jgi:hypothetical protein
MQILNEIEFQMQKNDRIERESAHRFPPCQTKGLGNEVEDEETQWNVKK